MKDVINESKLKNVVGGTSEGFAHKYKIGDIFKTTSAPVLYYKIIELLDGVDKTDNCPIYKCEVYKKVRSNVATKLLSLVVMMRFLLTTLSIL